MLGKRRSLSEIERALKEPSRRITPGHRVATVHLNDGSSLRGLVKNENTFDLQLQGLDGRLRLLARNEISTVDREKNSLMPPLGASEAEMRDLVAYLSRLACGASANSTAGTPPLPGAVSFDQIVSPKNGDWPTYHGMLTGNRHSAMDQINSSNVASLAARWSLRVGPLQQAGDDAGGGGRSDVRDGGE